MMVNTRVLDARDPGLSPTNINDIMTYIAIYKVRNCV